MSALDKIKNKLQAGKGRTKKAAGRATDDRSLEAEGKGDQVSGSLKQGGENIKECLQEIARPARGQGTPSSAENAVARWIDPRDVLPLIQRSLVLLRGEAASPEGAR